MAGTFIKPEDILRATNGGLDIILSLYPDAQKSVDRTGRKFKVRGDEKTASASLKKKFDDQAGIDVYLVTDFGGDSITRNGIGCYALENNMQWVDALKDLGARYGVTGEEYKAEVFKAVVEARDANPDEEEKVWTFEVKDSFSDFEIETLFSKYTLRYLGWDKGEQKKKEAYNKLRAVLVKYRFWALSSYTIIKDRRALTFKATENYPMFIIDEQTQEKKSFKKIYQPRHEDKGRRFMYYGEKPKDFIHGLSQARAEHQRRLNSAGFEEESDQDDDDDNALESKASRKAKLDDLILVSGGSDALNAAVLGYWVCWMNSETADLQEKDFYSMVKIAKKVYQLQDIDDTGKRSAHELALKFLDLYTIELPPALLEKRDSRGYPCKDLRDFLNHWNQFEFDRLVKDALPYRFWEQRAEFNKEGTFIGYKYEFDNVQAYNFLQKNGFARFPVEGQKSDYIFIRIDGNIVRTTTGNKVKNFMHHFLRDRRMEKDLRNKLYRSTQLNEGSLSNLNETEIDFTAHDERTQFLFFKNITWEVTAAGITEHKPGRVKRYVWEEDVIDHHVKALEPAFEIKKDGERWTIDFKNKDCLFLRLLIQMSRIHWRRELEECLDGADPNEAARYRHEHKFDIAGPNLTAEEQDEQVMHLVNKIYAIGYLLHTYKDIGKAWAVIGMDGRFSDEGKSYGRSGKSLVFSQGIIEVIKKRFVIPGTNPRKTEDPHIFHGCTKHHRTIIVDDADRYLPFRFFFEPITNGVSVNPKNGMPYFIPFDESGKVIWLTNFTMDNDGSSRGRQLLTVFSDYYHEPGDNGEYREKRQPVDDFEKNIFKQFDEKEWNLFFNTMASCLQFYLGTREKVEPPMANVEKRTLQSEMGENFEAWSSVYFSAESGNLDRLVIKERAFTDFEQAHKSSKWSPQRFTRALRAFCKFHHYELNPKDFINAKDGKRIIRNLKEQRRDKDGNWSEIEKTKSYELIYIRTDFERLYDLMAGESAVPF